MTPETLIIDRPADGVALVTINRPDKLNAMNHAFFRDLPETLAALDADPEVRACVVTGAGSAVSVAARIAAHPPTAVQVGKRFLNRGDTGIAEAIEATALLFTTDEHKQRVDRFLGR